MDESGRGPDDTCLVQLLVSGLDEEVLLDVGVGCGVGGDGLVGVEEGVADFAVESLVVVAAVDGGVAADDDGPLSGGVAEEERGVEDDGAGLLGVAGVDALLLVLEDGLSLVVECLGVEDVVEGLVGGEGLVLALELLLADVVVSPCLVEDLSEELVDEGALLFGELGVELEGLVVAGVLALFASDGSLDFVPGHLLGLEFGGDELVELLLLLAELVGDAACGGGGLLARVEPFALLVGLVLVVVGVSLGEDLELVEELLADVGALGEGRGGGELLVHESHEVGLVSEGESAVGDLVVLLVLDGLVEVRDADVAAGLLVEEGDDDVASRAAGDDVLGESEEGGGVGGSAGSRGEVGDFAEGVEVGGEDDDLMALVGVEFGVGALDVGVDVASACVAPVEFAVDGDGGVLGAVGLELRGGAVEVVAHEVDVAVGEVGAGGHGLLGHVVAAGEDDGLGSESEGADEALSGVVVEDDDGVLDVDAVEVGGVAASEIDDVTGDASAWGGGWDDAVGPHGVESDGLAGGCGEGGGGLLVLSLDDGVVAAVVGVGLDGGGDDLGGVEGLHDDLVAVLGADDGAEPALDVVGCLAVLGGAGEAVREASDFGAVAVEGGLGVVRLLREGQASGETEDGAQSQGP